MSLCLTITLPRATPVLAVGPRDPFQKGAKSSRRPWMKSNTFWETCRDSAIC
jgi:hypothetical protein